MTVRDRLLVTLTLVLVAAAPLALTNAAGARRSAFPTLYVTYGANCAFTITDDSRASVTSIAPGAYQILVSTPVVFNDDPQTYISLTSCTTYVRFQLTGPGVNVRSTLSQGDEDQEYLSATFQPNSTYTAVDNNQPSTTRVVFTTTASGTASTAAGSGSSSSSSGGSTQQQLVGSAASVRGTVQAIVHRTGAISLARGGMRVRSLKAGRWSFSIEDESAASGLSARALHGKTQTLTSATFVGSRAVALVLQPGRWTFFSQGGKTRTTVFVTR